MGRVITNPTGSVVDASEVKILYESNENTNAYTDGDKASLGEVKDAIDMAKKVVEITFLLNDWTSNSDGTYSQTVNNSEIKSSMNPDLISMLSSGATPEEQKTYMKNFSILCQGVGNTADGSVTYKIYKQMTGDITVGLTRLGGVRQIESEAKVDDVTVGGVSVVENKVAKIPEIPSANAFVPYENATKDVDIGDHSLVVKATGSRSNMPISSEIRVGKTTEAESGDSIPGISISTELTGTFDGLTMRSSLEANADYDGLFASVESEQGSGFNSTQYQFSASGFSVGSPEADLPTVIKPGVIRGLDLPTTNDSAASKEYVDSKSVIINHITLGGLAGETSISSNDEYTAMLSIDKDTPLPPNKLIGITIGFAASESDLTTHPNMKGLVSILDTITGNESSNSGTLVIGFAIEFACRAQAKNSSSSKFTTVDTFSAASVYVNIVTDGVMVSLDKTQSRITQIPK